MNRITQLPKRKYKDRGKIGRTVKTANKIITQWVKMQNLLPYW